VAGSYFDFADDNVMVVVVVETATAVANIEEIAAVPGIDVLFIGTSDLSFSLGLRGKQDEPRLEEAIAKIVAAGKKHGKFLGRPGRTVEDIRRFEQQGFQFFQAGMECDFVAAGAAQLLKPLGKSRAFGWGGAI
jgi:2-keto-3-deoxy-L-rhamnonate aldolase RhmA